MSSMIGPARSPSACRRRPRPVGQLDPVVLGDDAAHDDRRPPRPRPAAGASPRAPAPGGCPTGSTGPTTSGSSSRADAAICPASSRMPEYTTSMPASRAATAICSAPLEWPSRPGLATSSRGGPPAMRPHPLGHRRQLAARRPAAARDAGGRPVLAEHLAQGVGPLARRAAGVGEGDRGRHDVLGRRRPPGAGRRAPVAPRRRRGGAATPARRRPSRPPRPGRRAGSTPAAAAVTALGLGEPVDAHDDLLARLDAAGPLGQRPHEAALQLVDRLERAAQGEHVVELGRGGLDELRGPRLHTVRAVEDVLVLEQVASRRPGPVAFATTTAGPTAGAGRGPRSRPGAGSSGPGPASTA